MTLLRKAFLALMITLAILGSNQILLFVQGLPLLLWPALILRLALMMVTLPALLLQFWAKLHLGVNLSQVLLVWPLLMIYNGLWGSVRKLREAIDAPALPSRRAFLAGSGVAVASGYGVARSYPAPQVTRLPLPLKDLPTGLVGKRLVLLSDLHRGPAISRDYLEAVVRQVNGLHPDIVLMPGDFVSKSSAYFPDVTAVLSKLRPKIASLASLGNHDHYEGAEEAKRALSRAGVLVLHNRSIHLEANGSLSAFGDHGLCFAGVDDLGAGKPDFAAAMAGVSSTVPVILLAHNPDFAEHEMAAKSTTRIDLQVSGHTHGGQVLLPGVGPVVSGSRYGMKYLCGMVQGPRWPVFVTRGVGASVLPIRVGAPAEIVLFELQALT